MTERASFSWLEPKLCNDLESAQLSIGTFISSCHEYASKDPLTVLDQLKLLLDFVHKKSKDTDYLTVKLYRALGHLYTHIFSELLRRGEPKFSTKLSDLTGRLSDVITSQGKKITLHGNWYNSSKHLALIILEFLFDKFSGFIGSYKEGLVISLYQQLDKCNNNYNTAIEDSIFVASYFTDMVNLIDIITAGGINFLPDKYFKKLLRLSRHILARDSECTFIYPLPALVHSINIMCALLKSDQFMSSLSERKVRARPDYYLHTIDKYLTILFDAMNSDHKQLRLASARCIAELMVFDYISLGINYGHANDVLHSNLIFLLQKYQTEDECIKIGVMETVIQLISKLNLCYQSGTISNGQDNFVALHLSLILHDIYTTIFGPLKFSDKASALKTLHDLKTLYSFLVRELNSDANELIILSKLILSENSTDFPSLKNLPDGNTYYALSLLDFAQILISNLGEYILNRQEGTTDSSKSVCLQIADVLFHECIDDKIGFKAAEVLSQVVGYKPELAVTILQSCMQSLTKSLSNRSKANADNSYGLAYLMSLIICYGPFECISKDIILTTLTLCTNSLKKFDSSLISTNLFGSGASFQIDEKTFDIQKSSWVLMMGLFNLGSHDNLTSLWVNGAQFIPIWKSLLGRSIPSDFVIYGLNGDIINLDDILRFLNIQNYSLMCLTMYLRFTKKHLKMTTNFAAEMNSLIIKDFNFICGLSNMIHDTIPLELKSTIVLSKVRMYQALAQLLPSLDKRTEMNSALLLQAVKDFSSLTEFSSTLSKSNTQDKYYEYEIYRQCDGICYGMTSRMNGFNIKGENIAKYDNQNTNLAPLTCFDDTVEDWFTRIHIRDLVNDPLEIIWKKDYPVCTEIMVVDWAIEVFSLTFPFLTANVQQSIIESVLSSALTHSKASDEPKPLISLMRKKAVRINSSISFYQMLNYMNSLGGKQKLTEPICQLLAGSLKNFGFGDAYLSRLNAASIGLCCSLVENSPKLALNQISISINSIVSSTTPLSRAFDVDTIVKVLKYTSLRCPQGAFETITTLCRDPHPVVHASAIDALSQLFFSQQPIEYGLPFTSGVLKLLWNLWISDNYGIYSPTTVSCNMNYRSHLSSATLIAKTLKTLINATGPLIHEWSNDQKDILHNLLFEMLYLTTISFPSVSRELMISFEELSVFDSSTFVINSLTKLINCLIENNFRVGIRSGTASYMPIDEGDSYELYPLTTSDSLWSMALDSYEHLLKLSHEDLPDFKNIWTCLDYHPSSSSIRNILDYIIDSSNKDKKYVWIKRLIRSFDTSETAIWADIMAIYKTRIKNEGLLIKDTISQQSVMHTSADALKRSKVSKRLSEGEEEEVIEDNGFGENLEALNGANGESNGSDKQNTSDSSTKDGLNSVSAETHWEFKLVIVRMLTKLLDYCVNDDWLRTHCAASIPDFIRISFVCSTSSMITLRICSLNMLQLVINIFYKMRDPVSHNHSILDQQQAQIMGAISPAFEEGSTVDTASKAYMLLSKLITSSIIPLSRVDRGLNILTSSLEMIANTDYRDAVRVGKISVPTSDSKLMLRAYILRAWASLKIEAKDKPLINLLHKYNDVLIPLWFYTLRDYAEYKYGTENTISSIGIDDCWLDILMALSKLSRESPSVFDKLLGDETANFFFVVFGECIECLIGISSGDKQSKRGAVILDCLQALLHLDVGIEIIFKDVIFTELIDLLDRMVSISNDLMKEAVIKFTKALAEGYFNYHGGKIDPKDIDKLFELLRVDIHTVDNIISVVQEPVDGINLNADDLLVLKHAFDSVADVIKIFPQAMVIDLYSCILYIFTMIYRLKDKELVSTLLPTLKRIVSQFNDIDSKNPNLKNFYLSIKPFLNFETDESLLTILILISTLDDINIEQNVDGEKISDLLMRGLVCEDTNLAALSTKTVQNLILHHPSKFQENLLTWLVPDLIEVLSKPNVKEPRLIIGLLTSFAKVMDKHEDALASRQLIVPILLWFAQQNGEKYADYAHKKLLGLVEKNSTVFKEYVDQYCDTLLKEKIGKLVRFKKDAKRPNYTESDVTEKESNDNSVPHISLRTFK